MAKYTDTGIRVVVTTHARGSKPSTVHVVEKDVVTLSASKDLASSGSFHLTLFPRQEYLKLFRPNDWVEVYGWNEEGEELLVWGPLNSVTRSRAVGENEAVQERINLIGHDFTKVFMHIEVFFDPLFDKVTQIPGRMDSLAALLSGAGKTVSPGEVVKALLRFYVHRYNQFRLPNGQPLVFLKEDERNILDIDTYVERDLEGGGLLASMLTNVSSGNLWNLLRQYANPMMNLFYADVMPETDGPIGNGWRPYLRLARLPYAAEAMQNLPGFAVSAVNDVRASDIGFHDHDVRNWFRVHPTIFNTEQVSDAYHAASGALANKDSIKVHGIRRFEPHTPYGTALGVDSDVATGKDTVQETCNRLLNRVASWYYLNETLLTGTYRLRFRPDARVGMRLDEHDEYTGARSSFLIESVEHQWQMYPPQSSTTVQVTRGTTSTLHQGPDGASLMSKGRGGTDAKSDDTTVALTQFPLGKTS